MGGRATLVLREKMTDESGNLREMVIWRVAPNARQPDGVRYAWRSSSLAVTRPRFSMTTIIPKVTIGTLGVRNIPTSSLASHVSSPISWRTCNG